MAGRDTPHAVPLSGCSTHAPDRARWRSSLPQEIVANAAKVQTALKLSQEDQNTIASLKREIEKAWKMVDAAHEKEGRAKETISQLKHEIQNLSRCAARQRRGA